MASVNKVTLIGRVGNSPELKQSKNNIPYVQLSLAVEGGKDKNTGTKITTWFPLKFYDSLAHTCVSYIEKGSLLYVEGSLKLGEYEKNGIKQKSIEVVCKYMEILGKPSPQTQEDKENLGTDYRRKTNDYLRPQRDINKLVEYDPKVNPLRNIESAPFDNDHNNIPF